MLTLTPINLKTANAFVQQYHRHHKPTRGHVSQTDGEPIPSLEVNELTASIKDYALLTAAIEQVSPVPMRFDEIEGDAKGYYSDV